jgi:cytoskeletal protein CcmA (bactofilin family)
MLFKSTNNPKLTPPGNSSKSSVPAKSPQPVQTKVAPVRNDLPVESNSRTSVAASLISENLSLDGEIISIGDVHLDGSVRGHLRVNHLTISESGRVDGAIEAESVDVRGSVIGSIAATQVRLAATARVDGDITHGELSIEAGAFFSGKSLKFPAPAPVAAEPLSLVANADWAEQPA